MSEPMALEEALAGARCGGCGRSLWDQPALVLVSRPPRHALLACCPQLGCAVAALGAVLEEGAVRLLTRGWRR